MPPIKRKFLHRHFLTPPKKFNPSKKVKTTKKLLKKKVMG